jgi:hypothetical protein
MHRSLVRRTTTTLALVALVAGACAAGGSATFASFTEVPADRWGADEASVDLGLRPTPDALAYPNSPDTDRAFSAVDLIALFGADGVCEAPEGDCVIRPAAQQWAERVAAAVPGGVCEGMAVFSLDRFAARSRPPAGELERSRDLDRRVVRLFATQFLPQVVEQAATSRGRPLRAVIDDLEQRLSGTSDPVTMGLYVPGRGHSVVPYAIERPDDQRAVAWVYDPNWPGQDRYVEFDLEAGRWRFAFGGEDPADDADDVWFGGPDTLDVVGLSVREAPFAEPFSGAGAGRPLLAITATAGDWSARRTGTGEIVADQDALPGVGGVEGVTRGAFDTVSVTARFQVGDPTIVTADDRLRLEVTTPVGSVAATLPTGGSVEVTADDAGITLRDLSSPARMQVAVPGGWISVDAGAGAEVVITADAGTTRLRLTPSASAPTIELTFSGARRDLAVSRSGAVTVRATPTWPASVRDGIDPDDPENFTLPPAPSLPLATLPSTTTTEPEEDPDATTTTVRRATTTTVPRSPTTTRPPSTTTTVPGTTTTKPPSSTTTEPKP